MTDGIGDAAKDVARAVTDAAATLGRKVADATGPTPGRSPAGTGSTTASTPGGSDRIGPPLREVDPDPGNRSGVRDTAGDSVDHG